MKDVPPPKAPLAGTPADYEEVRIDLDAAVRKMAIADGIQDATELGKTVGVKRYDRYADQVRAYYGGYDDGYKAGVVAIGGRFPFLKLRLRQVCYVTVATAGVTVVVPAAVALMARVAIYIFHVVL